MFKAPDKHRPREWGQSRRVGPLLFAAYVVVATFLIVGHAIFPLGPEIALVLGAIGFGILVYRQSDKQGT